MNLPEYKAPQKKAYRISVLWTIALLALGLVHIIPLWSLKYFPSQDGPSHIYNAHAFLQLFDDGNWRLDQVFRQNIGWIPNSIAHLFFVAGQGMGFDPLVVEKVFLSLTIIGLPLSIHYVATALSPQNRLVGLVGFILAFHNLLHMGFYSYSVSVPLALLFLGTFLRWRIELTIPRALTLIILGHLVFLSHFSSMAILLLLLACVMAIDLITVLINLKKQNEDPHLTLRGWFRNGILLLAIGAPALVYHLMAGHPDHGRYMGQERLISLLFEEAMLVTYTADHYRIAHWLWLVFGLSLFAHVLVRLFRRKIWEPSDLFMVMAFAVGWLYFDLPNSTHGGGWVNHRPLLFLLIFLWLSLTRFPVWLQALLGMLLLYISFYQLILFHRDYQMLQPHLHEYEGVASKLEPHSSIKRRVSGGHTFPMRSLRVDPFLHAPCYTAMGKDMAYIENYEANHRYFWVNHRHGSRSSRSKVDYQILWNQRDSVLGSDYEEIFRQTHLKIFKLKSKDVGLKQDQPLKIRFSNSSRTSEQRISIYRPWEPGKIGFLETRGLEAKEGGVRSYHPNTLRLDVPNGKYRANLLFKSENKSTFFSLRAGDDLLRKSIGTHTMGYRDSPSVKFDVTEGRIDLAFTPLKKKGNSPNVAGYWALLGLDLYPMEEDTETGLEIELEGWSKNGFFSDPVHLSLKHATGNVTYSTDGTNPDTNSSPWPKEGLTLKEDFRLMITRWIDGRSIATAEAQLKHILRISPDWVPPIDLIPPGALDGRVEEGPLQGYFKVHRAGRHHFRTYDDIKAHLGGSLLPLKSGEILEVWLDQGTYSLSVTSEEADADLFWAVGNQRESPLTRKSLWLEP